MDPLEEKVLDIIVKLDYLEKQVQDLIKNNVQDKVQILKLTKEIQDLKQEKQKAS